MNCPFNAKKKRNYKREREKMKIYFLLYLFAFTVFFIQIKAKSISLLQPHNLKSFNLSYLQQVQSCSYTVIITTSCSSVSYTRDQISIAFGDAYGNQIYAPRLDDPSTKTFESCSTDTFQINGPCAYQICYVYLYRSGPDGWMPENVKIYGSNSRAVTFYYNTFTPGDIWYGFNLCSSASSSTQEFGHRWFIYVVMGVVLGALL
ncbi:ATS3 domain-containing protein [Cephalotus follicularis]|uniref:ATS3 domain-containing protein n=1 Tax=Cephalotus follicularis TaxID=3775 RepID=A0A1Q3BEI3_CEPFO|nr:ATS3 domain-containing protein [Cephalotus follicularis]